MLNWLLHSWWSGDSDEAEKMQRQEEELMALRDALDFLRPLSQGMVLMVRGFLFE